MPVDGKNGHAHNGVLVVLGAPEVTEELFILLVVEDVHLASLVVLELGVVEGLLRDAKTTPEPDAHNLLLLLSSEDEVASERPLSDLVTSLEVTLAQVFSLVEDFAFISVHLVVHEPDGETFSVHLLHQLVDGSTLLVGMVHHKGLEVEQVEAGFGQELESGLWLLGRLVLVLIVVLLGLRGSLGGNLLLLNLDLGLDTLLAGFDVTADSNELGESDNTLPPGRKVGHGLSEATVEDGLLGNNELGGQNNVGEGNMITNEPVLALKVGVNVLGFGLDGVHGGGVVSLGDLTPSVNGHSSLHHGRSEGGVAVHAPLVNLGALLVAGAHKGGVSVSEVLGNGVGFAEVALGGGEEGEFSSHVDSLELLGSLELVGCNLDLDFLAVHVGSDSSGESPKVEGVVDVKFLYRRVTKMSCLLTILKILVL